jgi:putative transposase
MGRAPRIIAHGVHYHVIVRCNNQAFHFEGDEDFSRYLSILEWVQKKHRFKLFNYELMNSHVHLFLEPSAHYSLIKTMLLINGKYSREYNRRKGRKGHFWMDRYKCIPVETDSYALGLMRYINRNPIRAGMVEVAGEWPWSGSRFYLRGEVNNLLTPHPCYLALGFKDQTRQERYREFVEMILPSEDRRDPYFSEGVVSAE